MAFEFWSRRALGIVRDSLVPGPVDPTFQVQVFCLRPRVDRPQVLATSRHVTCGGPDLSEVTWTQGALSGVSQLVPRDPYEIFLTEPAGYRLDAVEATGGRVRVVDRRMPGATRVVRLESPDGGAVRWRVRYRKEGG